MNISIKLVVFCMYSPSMILSATFMTCPQFLVFALGNCKDFSQRVIRLSTNHMTLDFRNPTTNDTGLYTCYIAKRDDCTDLRCAIQERSIYVYVGEFDCIQLHNPKIFYRATKKLNQPPPPTPERIWHMDHRFDGHTCEH